MADETVPTVADAPATTQIQVRTDALTIDDLVFLEDMGEGKVKSMRAIRDFFDRMVVGGVGTRKIRELVDISKAILEKVSEESNPKETA